MTEIEIPESNGRAGIDPQLTLPSHCFTDAAIYAREMETIYQHCWQPVGHAADVAEPGTYLTGQIAGQDVVVIRDHDGNLRGFFNVCQHRGHRLLRDKGELKSAIVCPYHAWSYGLDSRLRGAPNAKNVAGFDNNRVCLVSVSVIELGALVLVNLDPDASFELQFPGVAEELEVFAPRLSELTFHRSSVAEMACNWKVAVDNFAECYHCAHAHPSLTTELLDADAYRIDLFRHHHRHSTRATDGNVKLYEIDRQAGHNSESFRAWLLWPNFALQVNPGSIYVVFHFIPDGPERTIAKLDWFFGPWVDDPERERIVDEHSRTTLDEDKRLVAEVQIGLNNAGYDRGVLMVDDNHTDGGFCERPVAHLQNLWREIMECENGENLGQTSS